MDPKASFFDFRWYFQQFATLHTAAFFVGPDIIMDPAPMVVGYWSLYRFQPFATPIFLSFIGVTTALAASPASSGACSCSSLSLAALRYPVSLAPAPVLRRLPMEHSPST